MIRSKWLRGLLIPLIIIGIWYLSGNFGILNRQLMPEINKVFNALVKSLGDGSLSKHILISLQRVGLGFGIATIVAIPTGLLLGWFPKLQPWITPTLDFLRQIPPVAWIPLVIMWFGIGEGSKLAIIFYAAFFPILLNTQLGVTQISWQYREVASLYRLSWLHTLIKLMIPGSIQSILAGLRLGLGMSWRALVAAEMIAASGGLGYFINSARSLVRLDQMVVGILVIGFFGLVIDRLFIYLERSLPWNKEQLHKEEVREYGYPHSTKSQ